MDAATQESKYDQMALATATGLLIVLLFTVSIRSARYPLPLHAIHNWTIQLRDRQMRPVEGASIVIDGGMPEHDHGLPTRPRVRGTQLPTPSKSGRPGTAGTAGWHVHPTIDRGSAARYPDVTHVRNGGTPTQFWQRGCRFAAHADVLKTSQMRNAEAERQRGLVSSPRRVYFHPSEPYTGDTQN